MTIGAIVSSWSVLEFNLGQLPSVIAPRKGEKKTITSEIFFFHQQLFFQGFISSSHLVRTDHKSCKEIKKYVASLAHGSHK
jgi:hypothetical protein